MLEKFEPLKTGLTEKAISFDILPEKTRPALSDPECFNKVWMLLEFLQANTKTLDPFDKYGYVNVQFKNIAYLDHIKKMTFKFRFEVILPVDYEFGMIRMYFK